MSDIRPLRLQPITWYRCAGDHIEFKFEPDVLGRTHLSLPMPKDVRLMLRVCVTINQLHRPTTDTTYDEEKVHATT